MLVRIKRAMWLKPRICPDCKKICLFARNYQSVRCEKCHTRRRRRIKRARGGLRSWRWKHSESWRRKSLKIRTEHPYCALCGNSENLTVHHIVTYEGKFIGQYTVLCAECHVAHEKRVMKKTNLAGKIHRLRLLTREV